MISSTIKFDEITTPIGPLITGTVDNKICFLEFKDSPKLRTKLDILEKRLEISSKSEKNKILPKLETQLNAYFQKKLKVFDLPLLVSGTPFQKNVYTTLTKIPYGKTISYKEQARQFGNSQAYRAVANANAKNNIVILIPCHRVIGSNGTLTGYAAGLNKKQYLLDLESNIFKSDI